MGGLWYIFPENNLKIFSILCTDSSECKFIIPMYSFPALNNAERTRVAFPKAHGNTPVTFGSNVPPCPAFVVFKIFLTHETTS